MRGSSVLIRINIGDLLQMYISSTTHQSAVPTWARNIKVFTATISSQCRGNRILISEQIYPKKQTSKTPNQTYEYTKGLKIFEESDCKTHVDRQTIKPKLANCVLRYFISLAERKRTQIFQFCPGKTRFSHVWSQRRKHATSADCNSRSVSLKYSSPTTVSGNCFSAFFQTFVCDSHTDAVGAPSDFWIGCTVCRKRFRLSWCLED